jgi:hypothetical protein
LLFRDIPSKTNRDEGRHGVKLFVLPIYVTRQNTRIMFDFV